MLLVQRTAEVQAVTHSAAAAAAMSFVFMKSFPIDRSIKHNAIKRVPKHPFILTQDFELEGHQFNLNALAKCSVSSMVPDATTRLLSEIEKWSRTSPRVRVVSRRVHESGSVGSVGSSESVGSYSSGGHGSVIVTLRRLVGTPLSTLNFFPAVSNTVRASPHSSVMAPFISKP